MNPDNIGTLIDLAMWIACLYCLYSWAWMRKNGKIHENPLLMPPKSTPAACRDHAAYLQYIMPRLLIFGVIGSVLGGLMVYGNMKGMPREVWIPTYVLFLVNAVWFALAIRTSIKRYWNV